MTTTARALLVATVLAVPLLATAAPPRFEITESTIDELHRAIRSGATTCRQVVQAYIDRARAYNGMCTALVTADGAPIEPAPGIVRAQARLTFPRETVPIAKVLPNFAEYRGKPIEYGRLEPTQSDPGAVQQFGMVTGIADAGQLNALTTLNIRGERSVSCKGAFDAHPSTGALPPHAPPECERFRRQPDALERAAELDEQYGRKPDLAAMPMYCVAFSFKDAVDTKGMRSTSGADVSYAMDAPPADATLVARLRAKGAIIYAKANLSEYNGGGGNPGGLESTTRTYGAGATSTWGGTACNPYDTTMETGGSSSGSAVSVSASLAHCSICEETGGSCRQPAWRNGIVGLMTTKGIMAYGGSVGADPYVDRPGLHCRTVADATRVLDALQDPELGYFDPRDIYTALPRGLVPQAPYSSFLVSDRQIRGGKPLAGKRVAIVREYMVKHAANDAAISDLADAEIKRVLRDRLGAELVETVDPRYPDDPEVPNVAYTFQDALGEILPLHMPELLQARKDDGTYRFAVEGVDVGTMGYLLALAEGDAPLSGELNLRSINDSPPTGAFRLHLAQYLARRGDAKVKDWTSLNANAKYYHESRAVAMKNWESQTALQPEGITYRMKMREVARMALMKVMLQNRIDVFVNPTITLPPARIGFASQPTVQDRPVGRFPTSANLGIPEITVPGGYNRVVYEPRFALNEARDAYEQVANEDEPTELAQPMPFGISFWAGPGDEPRILQIASAYEAATRHRVPPPAFGPLPRSSLATHRR